MADDPELTVSYSVDPPGMTADSVRLPQVSRRMTKEEVLLARGTADSFALRRKYHDAKTFGRYMPQGQMARDLYEAMETARCEAVGARDMPGTHGNIDAKIAAEAERKGYGQIRNAADAPLATAAGYLIRHLATGRPRPRARTTSWASGAASSRSRRAARSRTPSKLADQAAFARFARQIIEDLGYGDQLGDDPDAADDEDDEAEGGDEEDSPDQQGSDENQDDESEASPEQSQDQTQDASEAQVSMDDLSEMEMGEEAELPEGEAPLEPPPPAPHSDADPNYKVYHHRFRRGDPGRGSGRGGRARTPARLSRPAARAAEGRRQPACQQAPAPAPGAAEPQLGIRPGGRHPRRRAASPAWWRTPRRPCPSRSRRTPNSATRW
jgi:cobaltochelatase CobT